MALLPQPPVNTPIPVKNGFASFLSVQAWVQFFQAIYTALNRQSYTVTVGPFTNVPTGTYGSQFVAFPAGVLSSRDFILLGPLALPQGTLLQAMASGTPNEVVIFFHNYSGANQSLAALKTGLTVVPYANIAGN